MRPLKGYCHNIFHLRYKKKFLVLLDDPNQGLDFCGIFFHGVTDICNQLPSVFNPRESRFHGVFNTRESTKIASRKHLLVPNTPGSQNSPVMNNSGVGAVLGTCHFVVN
jgi:hypothetical protein